MDSFLFFLCGNQKKASSRVRGYWIAEALEEEGVKCSLEPRHTKSALVMFALKIPFHTVIVFQKSYSRWHCWLLRWANLLRKKTVLDLDDAPSRTFHPGTMRNVEYMMGNVLVVTVGSKVLLEYASRYSGNVHLIPSSIQLKYYYPNKRLLRDKKTEPICLGWIGNGAHYKQDLLEILIEPLTEVSRVYPIRFKLIGACGQQELYETFKNIPGLELDFIDQIEWSDPSTVANALQDIDLGLYPLLSNEFNKYKCGFKALEYMAMKIPVISSNVAENQEIITHGQTGLFAMNSVQWQDAFQELSRNESLRKEMGENCRALVEKRYSINAAAKILVSLVEDHV